MASKMNDIIISYKRHPVTDYPPNLKKVVRVGYSEDAFFLGRWEERKFLWYCSVEYTYSVLGGWTPLTKKEKKKKNAQNKTQNQTNLQTLHDNFRNIKTLIKGI